MVAELENEMQLPLPSKHLDQVHQVRVLQVLQHSAKEVVDYVYDYDCGKNDNKRPDLSKSDLLDERVVLTFHKLLDGNQVA